MLNYMTQVQKFTLLATIFMAAASFISCGQHDPFGNSFVDGSDEGDEVVLGDILGSCIGTDRGTRACVEIFNLSDGLDLSVARENCSQNNGTWSTGSACPEWYIDFDYSLDGSGVIYYYPNPVQLPSNAIALAAGQKMAGRIAELDGEVWYKFNSTAGASYYFSWNDFYSGDASEDMADVVVDVYNGDGELIFRGDDEDNSPYPGIIALESGDWVYVRVVRISREGGLKFSVVYNGGEMPSSSSVETPSSSSYEDSSSSSMMSDEEEEDDE
jgi:hypothetical protein